jgi:FkbM family methyltransferase
MMLKYPKEDFVEARVLDHDMIIKINHNTDGDQYTGVLWYKGIYEEETTRYFKENIKEGDVVFDVGANLGYYTLLFARLVGSTGVVYAFEPDPEIFEILKSNVEKNGYDNVILYNVAVSDVVGETEFHIAFRHNQSSLIKSDFTIDTIRVPTITLDSLKIYPDFVKIDVEGAEYKVLCGMDGLLNLKDIVVVLEYVPKVKGFNSEGISDLLKDFEFLHKDKNIVAIRK